jgi:hypothetical protein
VVGALQIRVAVWQLQCKIRAPHVFVSAHLRRVPATYHDLDSSIFMQAFSRPEKDTMSHSGSPNLITCFCTSQSRRLSLGVQRAGGIIQGNANGGLVGCPIATWQTVCSTHLLGPAGRFIKNSSPSKPTRALFSFVAETSFGRSGRSGPGSEIVPI